MVSVHVVFNNKIIPKSTSECVAVLERLKIEVASESRDLADYRFLSDPSSG